MKTFTTTSLRLAKTLVVFFGLVMVGILLLQSPQTSISAGLQTERVFENAIPENAPIRIKIRKEKEASFKDLRDENWVREFELEVINTGDKPIFFLFLHLITDVRFDGSTLMFTLVYGRPELGDIITKAGPDDPSIKPGETYVFKIHPGQVRAWEHNLHEKGQLDASRIKANIEGVSFGDGTGYFLNKPYPRADKLRSALDDPTEPPNKGGPLKARRPAVQRITSSIFDMPVMSLPANFLSSEYSEEPFYQSAGPLDASCGLFDYCRGIVPFQAVVCVNCNAQNRPGFDPAGDCAELAYGSMPALSGMSSIVA